MVPIFGVMQILNSVQFWCTGIWSNFVTLKSTLWIFDVSCFSAVRPNLVQRSCRFDSMLWIRDSGTRWQQQWVGWKYSSSWSLGLMMRLIFRFGLSFNFGDRLTINDGTHLMGVAFDIAMGWLQMMLLTFEEITLTLHIDSWLLLKNFISQKWCFHFNRFCRSLLFQTIVKLSHNIRPFRFGMPTEHKRKLTN